MGEKKFSDAFTIQLCEKPNLIIKTYYFFNNLYNLECYISLIEFQDGHTEKLVSPYFNSKGSDFLKITGLCNYFGDSDKFSLICIQKLKEAIQAKRDCPILLSEYTEICNTFPFFQMYADKIYKIIYSSYNDKLSKDFLESLDTLCQNIQIIFDYLVSGVLYPNLTENSHSIKQQLFEYEEIRESKGEKNYFLEWDLRDRIIIDQYPTNIHELYNNSFIALPILQSGKKLDFSKLNVARGTTSHMPQSNISKNLLPQELANAHYAKPQNNTSEYQIELPLNDKSVSFKQVSNSCNDTSLIRLFINLINYWNSSNKTITRCKLCGRHFVTANTKEKTQYCNLLFHESKSTCQEMIISMRYKSSQRENPITKIYTTVYNRVFSRVRRGVLDATLAPYEDLRNMRNKYLLLYDKADESDKKIIENKFAEEINSFANDFLNSHCKA